MRRLAVLSLHTSPLAQPGTGDGGGMNVYVRELSSALARAGVACDLYTRRDSAELPDTVFVEPGLEVHHIAAGPSSAVPKEQLHEHVEEFTEGVIAHMTGAVPRLRPRRASSNEIDEGAGAVHANYWLSGLAGHAIKHRLDVPLVSTFHTLDRVRAEASPEEVETSAETRRSQAEATIVGCSDLLLASCTVEADQLVDLYGADPARIEIIPLGVDHAFFSPGDRRMARRAIGLDSASGPLLLFVGRIQPLKGADVAVRALAAVRDGGVKDAQLVIVGGPSGPRGEAELAGLHVLAGRLGVADRVRFSAPQPHELLSTFYRAADCCLVPSRSESFGLVALEASACGIPVVAAGVGGLTTLVDDGRTGYLVEPGDAEGFARRVAEILADPELQDALGTAGALAARQYTWATAAARLRRIYSELTARALVEC